MFEYLEPSDRDVSDVAQGTGSLPLPPRSGANDKRTRSLNPEKVRHLLYGSLAGIDRTIKILHSLGYAEPNDWSEPMPVPPSGVVSEASPEGMPRLSSGVETWMVILTKTLLLE